MFWVGGCLRLSCDVEWSRADGGAAFLAPLVSGSKSLLLSITEPLILATPPPFTIARVAGVARAAR